MAVLLVCKDTKVYYLLQQWHFLLTTILFFCKCQKSTINRRALTASSLKRRPEKRERVTWWTVMLSLRLVISFASPACPRTARRPSKLSSTTSRSPLRSVIFQLVARAFFYVLFYLVHSVSAHQPFNSSETTVESLLTGNPRWYQNTFILPLEFSIPIHYLQCKWELAVT